MNQPYGQEPEGQEQRNSNGSKLMGKAGKHVLKKVLKKAVSAAVKKVGGLLAGKTGLIVGAIVLTIFLVLMVLSLFVPNAKSEKITDYATVGTALGIPPVELVAFDMVLYNNKLDKRNPNDSALYFLSLLYEEYKTETTCDENGENCSTSEVVTHSETLKGKDQITSFFIRKKLSLDDVADSINSINSQNGRRITTTVLSADDAMNNAGFTEKQKDHFYEIIETGLVEELYPELAVAVGGGGWWGGAITEFGANEIPAQYIPIYKAAQEKYGVPWNLVAAHHSVETKFSTYQPMISSVGAEGHLQFMPCTWVGWGHGSCKGGVGKGNFTEAQKKSPAFIKQYGGFGTDANGDGVASMWDITDAIHSAARYLAANGAAEGRIRDAVYAYNHADWYVEEVMTKANLYASGFVAVDIGNVGGGGDYPPGSMTVKHVAAHYLNNYRISTPFSTAPINDGWHSKGHFGIDLTTVGSSDLNDPIYSLSNGTVSQILPVSSTAGHGVRIKASDGYTFSYIHMNGAPRVKLGQKVSVGDVLGGIGNSASGSLNGSGGVHLDLKIKNPSGTHIDPAPLLKKWAGNWWVKKNTNAYPTSFWKAPSK